MNKCNLSTDDYTTINNKYFDRQSIWANLCDGEQKRIEDTLSLIPKDIKTILNVGCGDGRVTRGISHLYQITGVDISVTATNLFHGQATIGSVDSLPFRNESFDLVLATEVIEHLPDAILPEALRELQRVAKIYILITVPNNEVLEANFIQCTACQLVYHAWHHLHTFSPKRLKSIVCEFVPISLKPLGILQPILFRWPYRVLQRFGNTWSFSERAICPACSTKAQASKDGNIFGSLWKRIIWRANHYTPFKKKAFLGVLYKRKSNYECS